MILAVLLVFWTFFGLYFMYRNTQVYKVRKEILQKILDISLREIERKIYSYNWRIKEFEKVSYDEMLWKFWKPLNKFYKPFIWESMSNEN